MILLVSVIASAVVGLHFAFADLAAEANGAPGYSFEVARQARAYQRLDGDWKAMNVAVAEGDLVEATARLDAADAVLQEARSAYDGMVPPSEMASVHDGLRPILDLLQAALADAYRCMEAWRAGEDPATSASCLEARRLWEAAKGMAVGVKAEWLAIEQASSALEAA